MWDCSKSSHAADYSTQTFYTDQAADFKAILVAAVWRLSWKVKPSKPASNLASRNSSVASSLVMLNTYLAFWADGFKDLNRLGA